MQLNQAVSMRLQELLTEKNMTQYQLSTKRIVHEVCQGLEMGINEFFSSPFFDETNLDP